MWLDMGFAFHTNSIQLGYLSHRLVVRQYVQYPITFPIVVKVGASLPLLHYGETSCHTICASTLRTASILLDQGIAALLLQFANVLFP